MTRNLENEFKIVKNGSEKYWKEIMHQIVNDVRWQYSIHDYGINRKSFDYTVYFAIEKELEKVVAVVSLAKVALVNQPSERTLSIVGTFYVLPDYRGRRLGLWLFEEMLKDASDDQYLTADPSMWEKYRDRFGYDKIADYFVNYLSGSHSDLRPQNLKKDANLQIVDWQAADYDAICAYDTKISQCDRHNYLANTFGHPASIAKVALNGKGEIVGICRVRLMISEHIDVGPIYANDTIIASSLLRSCVECLLEEHGEKLNVDSQIFYKAPSTNSAAEELFANLLGNAKYEKSSCTLQFTKELLEIPISMIYSYTEATSMSTT